MTIKISKKKIDEIFEQEYEHYAEIVIDLYNQPNNFCLTQSLAVRPDFLIRLFSRFISVFVTRNPPIKISVL